MILNSQQLAIINHFTGPALAVAGPGAGKTEVLKERFVTLVKNKNISPEKILVTTFTNKAAKEVTERICNELDVNPKSLYIGTFHGICLKFLRKYIDYLGYRKNFTIYNDYDSIECLKNSCGLEVGDAFQMYDKIRTIKTNMWSSDYILEKEFVTLPELQIYFKYNDALKKANAVDFNDILLLTIKLMDDFFFIKEEIQNKFEFMQIDESQDSNILQHRLVEILCENHNNFMYFFDLDQSIYGFCNAVPDYLLKLKDKCSIYYLDHNYRSTKNIVKLASSLIENNDKRFPIKIHTNNKEGSKIRVSTHSSQKNEAISIANTLVSLKRKFPELDYKDIAVIFRTNAQAEPLENAFLNLRIPYHFYDGTALFDTSEIRDVFSFLRFSANSKDISAFRRIINKPTRGIGKVAEERIIELSKLYDNDLYSAIKNYSELKVSLEKLKDFINILDIVKSKKNIEESLSYLLTHINYIGYLKRSIKEIDTLNTKIQNVERFKSYVKIYSEENPQATLEDFTQQIGLLSSADGSENLNRVSLITSHSAKGLQWSLVFIAGVNENILPHVKSLKDIDEERRIFYVAMTRAKRLLFINSFLVDVNGRKYVPSRFLRELDQDCLELFS